MTDALEYKVLKVPCIERIMYGTYDVFLDNMYQK